MQEASEAYKQAMTQQCRDQFYMYVTIGVINQVAQNKAYVSPSGKYSAMSNLEKPFQNYDREYTYATLEENFFRLDGKMLFLPRNGPYFNQGIVTERLMNSITILFKDGPYDIKGLTIEFGEAYPENFLILSDNQGVSVSGNTSGHFVTDKVFEKATYITIRPTKMVNGQGRLRILKMSMGVGINFTNRQIKTSTKKEFLSWVSAELPTTDLNLTVKNEDRRFDVENEDSTLNFLEIGQKVEVSYGATLPNGEIEHFSGTTLLLDSWKASDEEVSFVAKDVVASLNDTYYWGTYGATNLYDLAVAVFEDAGLDEREYSIDSYLRNVEVCNPLPVATHAECLQIIANAGRAILVVDRTGTMHLKAGFTTVISPEKMVVTGKNVARWSNPQSVVLADPKYDYGILWTDYFRADGGMYFLPRGSNYLNEGYVSADIADSSGKFATPPSFTVDLEASFKYYGLSIEFGGNLPTKMQIRTYLDGEVQETYTHTAIQKITNVQHDFPLFDRIEFLFPEGKAGNGVIVRHVGFGDVADFSITYKTMTDTPTGARTTLYKNLKVTMTKYSESSEAEKELYKDTVVGGQVVDCYLNTASYGFSVNYGKITRSSAYAVRVDLSGISGSVELVVTGKEYLQNESTYDLPLNTTGETKRWNNALISDQEHAGTVAEWIGNYLNNNIEYEVPYRGDFRPDAGDIIFLQGHKTDRMQVFLEENNLSFSSGKLSGDVKARRAIDGTDTSKNGLGRRL